MYCIDFFAFAHNEYKKTNLISTKLTILYEEEVVRKNKYQFFDEEFFTDLAIEVKEIRRNEVKDVTEEVNVEEEKESELEEGIEEYLQEKIKGDVFNDRNLFFIENSNKEFDVNFNEDVEINSDFNFLLYYDDAFDGDFDEEGESEEDDDEDDDNLRFSLLKKKLKLRSEILSENNISYILIMKIQLPLLISGIYVRL